MRIQILLLVSIIMVACSPKVDTKTEDTAGTGSVKTASSSLVDIPYTFAKRYFVKNDYKKADHPNPKITSQEEFENIFGMARVTGEDGKPTPIDFSTQYVIGVIGELTNKNTEILPLSLKQADGSIELNYKVTEGAQRSATIQPVLILIVENKYTGEVKLVKN